MKTFAPHGGLIEISRHGRVLRVVGGGATNVEGIKNYLALLKPWVEAMRGTPWATLGIVDPKGALLTPEAEEFFHQSVPALSAAGRVAMALVCPPFPGSKILRRQWENIYAGSDSALELFEEEASALSWLFDRLRAHGVDEAELQPAGSANSGLP
ncbi:hypothetical protein [Pseudomarimonas arenosa]|uniref:STAS/SEC14 domain-containing protein n=1 Tax=Pseudomarimonas arenosa TaxID=2774145 RepID=A0AAW3ZKE5_9GAMM|nr:hypothetical protein [Pseudomarimonas arenosa]MBD8526486.1 hypothetical protein [Pseudomarimonas arenosa]